MPEASFLQWLGAFGIGSQYPCNLPTWFLRNLFILNIFSLVIKHIIDRFPRISLVLIILSFLFLKSTNCYYVTIDSLCYWCFGYYIVKYNINLDTFDNKKLLLPIYLISISFTTFLKLSSLNEFLLLVFSRINIVVSIAFWYSVFSKNLSGIVQSVFEKYSEYYFFVILLHEAILMAAIKIFFRVFEPTPIMQFVSFTFIPIAIAVFLILVAILFKKLLPKAYNVFTGQR